MKVERKKDSVKPWYMDDSVWPWSNMQLMRIINPMKKHYMQQVNYELIEKEDRNKSSG